MSFRLSKIDELSRREHHYLDNDDECWYFSEYTAARDWSFSYTNQLIKNFKKDVQLRGTNQWPYKIRAIEEVGKLIASALDPSNLGGIVLVPVPPSKITIDPAYDPRVLNALQQASNILGGVLTISECITQLNSTEADHQSGQTRLTPQERANTYCFHADSMPPSTHTVLVVDDVLTTGSHYKGIELVIKRERPHVRVKGLFIARTVHENSFDGIDISELLKSFP